MEAATGGLVGTPSEMNSLEAMMWRAEVDPRLRSPVVIVDVLDTAPDWNRLVAAHEWATRFVPRLRQQVMDPSWWFGAPAWVPDPNFDLTFHLHRQRATGPDMIRALLDLAEPLAMTPFDRARPLWEATLVDGFDDGRAGYLLKVHHSLADGVGLVQILKLLHSSIREHTENKADHPLPSTEASTRFGVMAAQTMRRIRDAPATLVGGLGNGAALLGRAVAHPVATASDTADFIGSVVRAATPPQVEGSPLLTARSLLRRFEALDIDLEELKIAGRAGGGSLNDAFVAALLGALRHYHVHFGEVPGHVPMGMPVSTRDRSHPLGGNHWAGTRFAAPLGEPDPATRIQLVREIVRSVTAERVVDGIGLIAPLLAVLPPPVLAQIQGGATSANDLQASNVPGMTRTVFLAGSEIVRSYAFGPLPGGAAMITLTSHRGTCCVAANLDPAAITDPELFLDCLHSGFAEILALATS